MNEGNVVELSFTTRFKLQILRQHPFCGNSMHFDTATLNIARLVYHKIQWENMQMFKKSLGTLYTPFALHIHLGKYLVA